MWKYLARRFANMIFTLWVITLISFVVIQLPPGDYVDDMVSRIRSLSTGIDIAPEFKEQMREMYGLDQPVYVQYLKWMRNIFLKGKFGRSLTYEQKDAGELIAERLPTTLAMSAFSVLFIWIVALPVGILSAVRQHGLPDYVASFLGFVGMAIPSFLLALIALYISYRYFGQSMIGLFSKEYSAAPWSGAKLVDLLKHLWVPGVVVGVSGTAGLIRTMRANLLDELRKPYMDTARAKGLPEGRLLLKYPVRHALNPFISTIGWTLPYLISGEAIVSIVLNLPTAGPMILQSLIQEDMFVAAGFILIVSSLTVVGTFVSDLLLAWLDPRIRLT
jgi:peptide/nickel transport system permease protein